MPRPIGGMSVSTRVPQAGGNYRVTGRTPPSGVPGRAAEQRQIADGTDPRLGTGISTACPAPTSRTDRTTKAGIKRCSRTSPLTRN